jgi:glycosyltransferase involved in cell wall biosynthesis
MRLLLVIPKLVSYRNFLRELCLSLVADGVEVHLACSAEKLWGGTGRPAEDGITMHVVEFARGMNLAKHLQAPRALDRLVRELRPDIIHAHFSAAIFTTALARTKRWPATFATFHGVAFLAMRGWKAAVLRVAESWAAGRFTAVWVLTDDDREGLRASAPGAVVRRLPGFGVGCDLEKFTPVNASRRAELRAALGIAPEQIAFAFVGRFTDFKGFHLTTRAFLQLAARHSGLRLLLIGSRDRLHPTGLDPAEEATLRNCPQVIDVGFRTDVEKCLAAADVMVFPSRREGMPVCLMEALALGVPAITGDRRGCRNVVRDSIDGLVLRNVDTGTLVAAMQRAAEDHRLRKAWSAHAVADRNRFSRQAFVAIQKRIYDSSMLARAALAPTHRQTSPMDFEDR